MLRATFLLSVILISNQALSAEVKLVCEDNGTSAVFFRKQSPTLGIDIYSIDLEAQNVTQLAGELKNKKLLSASITEAEIRFEQAGYISQEEIVETFQTMISRVSGKLIRYPHYVDKTGIWVSGDALERLARTTNLRGAFGIRQRPDEGNCAVDNRRF